MLSPQGQHQPGGSMSKLRSSGPSRLETLLGVGSAAYLATVERHSVIEPLPRRPRGEGGSAGPDRSAISPDRQRMTNIFFIQNTNAEA